MRVLKWKKAGVLILMLALLTSTFTACTQGQNTQESSGDTKVKNDNNTATGDSSEAKEEPYEFTMLGNLTTEMNEADEKVLQGIEEALNLKINVELPPSTSYTERLQLMLASGEYADLTLFPNHTEVMFVDAVKNGVFIPLNSYLEKAPNLKQYSYESSWEALKILQDDNIYAIPRTSISRADGFLIRQDWLDNLGIEFNEGEPLTLAQLEEIVTAFTKDDPDGNGADDTYGITSNCDDQGNIGVQFPWTFGLMGWHEYDGEYMDLMYSLEHDNFERALEYTNKLWKAGVIDPDWPTVKRDVSLDRFKKGIAGIVGEFAGWLSNTQNQGREMNPDYTLSYITGVIENPGDKYVGGSFSTGFWGCWAISSTAEKPDRIVEMMDYLLSDEYWDTIKYGPESVTWKEENGQKIAIGEPVTLMMRNTLRRNNDPQFFVNLEIDTNERQRIENLIGTCIDQFVFAEDRGFRPPVSDDPTFIDYQKQMKVQISKMIVGEVPISEWKNSILPGWYAAGGEEYIQQMQNFIKSQQ